MDRLGIFARHRMATMLFGLALLAPAGARAHDYWADADTLRPAPGSALNVWVTGGHDFPEVELALRADLLREVVLVAPDRTRTEIAVKAGEDKRHLGSVAIPAEPGVHLLEMVIQHPRQKQPRYVGRAILVVPGADAAPAAYATGHGAEIVPEAALDRLPADGKLPVSVRQNGEPVSATLTVYPAGGKPTVVRTAPGKPGQVSVEPGRKYLVVSSVNRLPVSLVFSVEPADAKPGNK